MPKAAPTSTRVKPGKKPKLSRAEKKVARAAKWDARRTTWRNLGQAFTMTRQHDKRLVPYLVGALVLIVVVVWLVASVLLGQPLYLSLPVGVLLGLTTAMLIFSRRAQTSAYDQAEGRPGAAAFVMDNLRGDWRVKQAVAGTTHLDAVHRLIGRPGIVLVGEGQSHRIRTLLAQEKKKVARVAGDTPIYDVIVGTGDDEVQLKKLNTYLTRLPRNLTTAQVGALDKRIAALGNTKVPLPQGPMPAGAKMRNVSRAARRRS